MRQFALGLLVGVLLAGAVLVGALHLDPAPEDPATEPVVATRRMGRREIRTTRIVKVKRVVKRQTALWQHAPPIGRRLVNYALGCRLMEGAAESLRHVAATLGVPSIKTVSCWRSHAQQISLYARKPGLAARPGTSLHERGLAADISTSFLARHPKLARLLRLHGWQQFNPGLEPWHFSFRLVG